MTIPNTFANLSGSIQLSLLDENFTYLDGAVATAVAGATGVQGASGVNGATGIQGPTGGASGPQGATGVQGASGSTGLTGAAGVQGASGSIGLTGSSGAIGATGSQGIQGSSGVQGATGIQGPTGGASGPQGLTGATGVQGATGIQGPTGGASGPQGLTGATGVQGVSGSTGLQGASGIGATGLAGATGVQGASGSTGLQGASGIGATGLTGATGIQGPTGGASGPQGPAGSSGIIAIYSRKTTTYTAVTSDFIIADTSGGPWTLTLPASPVTGNFVTVADGASWASNNLTIARNGNTIENISENLIVDIGDLTITLIYDGTTWKVFANIGPYGATGPRGATGALTPWSVVTGATGLVANAQYIINTTSGSFSVNLPASPSLGNQVVIQDGGDFSTNNLTITRNGSTIEGLTQDIIADIGGVLMILIYDGSTWQISINTGAAGATGVQGASGIGATGLQGIQGVSGATGTGIINSNWSIVGASGATGALYFVFSGVNKAKLDVDGNLSVAGDVIAYETIT